MCDRIYLQQETLTLGVWQCLGFISAQGIASVSSDGVPGELPA